MIFLMRIPHLNCNHVNGDYVNVNVNVNVKGDYDYVGFAKVKTEEKMTGGKGGKAQVNEAFQMNPHERGLKK